MSAMAQRVGPNQLGQLHEPLRLVGEAMERRFGLSHWVPAYPLDLFEKSAVERCVYAVHDGTGHTIATFTLGSEGSGYDNSLLWAEPNAKAAYLSRLAVHPSEQRLGLGARCMAQAERFAGGAGAAALRSDTHPAFDALHRFYERCGYERRGFVAWRDDDSLHCWEKTLAP